MLATRTVMSKAGAIAAAVAFSSVAIAAGPVTVEEAQWQFYQGGYWQVDDQTFYVAQNHYGGSLPYNHVFVDGGGVAFHSHAMLHLRTRETIRSTMFIVTANFVATATVAEEQPQGVAHAFAALSGLFLDFHVERESIYLGEPLLYGEDDELYGYGDTLRPGRYIYFESDPFPAEMAETAFVGAGGHDEDMLDRTLVFEFMEPQRPAASLRPVHLLQSLLPMYPLGRMMR